MAKYIGPVVRLNRAEGINLGLKGRRDTDDKHTKRLDKRPDSMVPAANARCPTMAFSFAKSRN